MIKASGNEVESFWPSMFAKALKGQNIEELLSNISAGAAAGPAGPAEQAPAAGGAAAKKEGIFEFDGLILLCREERREEGRRSRRRRHGRTVRRRVLSSPRDTEQEPFHRRFLFCLTINYTHSCPRPYLSQRFVYYFPDNSLILKANK